jgi:hypothetical protein
MSKMTQNSASSTDYEYPALCIPRALGEITQQEMRDIIHKLGLGEISKIVIKPKEFILPKWEMTTTLSTPPSTQPSTPSAPSTPPSPQTVSYNNIYIYFKRWNIDNPQVRKYRDNIIKGQTIKIVHKMIPTPIFWRCVAANFTTYNYNHHHHHIQHDHDDLSKQNKKINTI